jgi:hypothetical protein
MAKKWSAAQGPQPIPSDPRSQKAQDALLKLHAQFGKKLLAPPHVPIETGGVTGGRIAVKVVPPFDFALTINTPTTSSGFVPAITTAAASKNGQISCSALSANKRSIGDSFGMAGILFHPISEGILRVSANPTCSFQWSTNSLGNSEVRSGGSVALVVHALEQRPTEPGDFGLAGSVAAIGKPWDESATGQLRFDFGTGLQNPLSTQIAVSRSLIYLVFVDVTCFVTNVDWPGSLASSMMSVSIPSITWEFEPSILVAPSTSL